MAIKSVKLKTSVRRGVLLAAILACLAGVYFSAKWSFANTIAVQSINQTERAAPQEIAEFAVSLAVSDPQTHYALAALLEKSFVPENEPKSLREYELATALAPNAGRRFSRTAAI